MTFSGLIRWCARRGRCLFWRTSGSLAVGAVAVIFAIGAPRSETVDGLCVKSKIPNPVLLLAHKPSRSLHIIKAGRRIKKIPLKDEASVAAMPAGVYIVLRESDGKKYARWSFSRAMRRHTTTWYGRALVTDASRPQDFPEDGLGIPEKFAEDVNRLTGPGAVLVVADSHSTLGMFDSIGLFDETSLSASVRSSCAGDNPGWQAKVTDTSSAPVSVVISEREARIYVFDGNTLRESHPVRLRYPHRDTGRYVSIAIDPVGRGNERQWLALSLAGGGYLRAPPVQRAKTLLDRFSFDTDVQARLDDAFNRSVVLVVAERMSAKAFGVGDGLRLMHGK